MNVAANKSGAALRPLQYWRLWLFDTVLVTGAFLFFLATRYGTYEFFGKALVMALLPLIPVMVLVGGAGSTVFALTKILIEKRGLPRPTALALLTGPALVIALALGLLGAFKSPAHRLAYICVGHAPASAGQIQIAGYSTFLREEWLAIFQVEAKAFQTMVGEAKLVPVDGFEFRRALEHSSLKSAKLFRNLPAAENLQCYQRVFKEAEEHERGRVYAVFDPATSTAAVFREYHD